MTTTVNESADPVRRLQNNAAAVLLGSVLTGGLGLMFWAVAARLYPASELGRAAALISTATMIATAANASVGALHERFLPIAGRRAGVLIARSYFAVVPIAVGLSIALIAVGPRDRLFDNPMEMGLFGAFAGVLSAFALLDQTATGLQVARWGAVKNVLHAMAKLVLVVLFAGAGASVIVLSWGVPALVGVLVLAIAVTVRLRHLGSTVKPALPSSSEMWTYFLSASALVVCGTVAPLMIPLLIVSRLGTGANAYFAVTWSLVSAVILLVIVLTGPFVAAAAADPGSLPMLVRRFAIQMLATAFGASVFLAVVAPIGLGIVSQEYRAHGAGLLGIAAVVVPLSVVGLVYGALARVERRLRLAVAVQIGSAAIVILGTWILSPRWGVNAVGWSYLVAEAIAVAVLSVPLVRLVRRLSAIPAHPSQLDQSDKGAL